MLKKSRREFLDYPIEKGWKFRAYIEILGEMQDFIVSIEHESEKDSIIRFDQSSHEYFHVDILNETKRPYKNFPDAKTLLQKIECVFEFIKVHFNYVIVHNKYRLELDNTSFNSIKSSLINQIPQLELGKRTTRCSITSNANIVDNIQLQKETPILKDKILDVLRQVEAGIFDIKIINETKMIPMIILLERTGNPNLKEMKEAINELRLEKEIIVCSNPFAAKISKFLNHPKPTRNLLFHEPTEDELFIFSEIGKFPKE